MDTERPVGDLQLWTLCWSMAFVFTTKAMLTPLVPLFALALDASLATVGLLVSLSYVLPLFLAMPVGTLVDRWGSRWPIIIGAAMMGAAPLAVALSPGLLALAVAQVVSGLAHLVTGIGSQSYLATLGAGRARERNFGWYTTFASGGQLVGPLVAGLLVDRIGFQAAFSAGAAASVTGVVLAYVLRPRESGSRGRASFGGDVRTIGALLGNDGVRVGIVVSTSAMFAMAAYQAFFPVYLEGLAYSATAIGLFLSVKALVSMLVRPFMPGLVTLLRGRGPTLLVMVLFISAGLGMTGFVSSVALISLACVLFGIGFGISQPLSMVAVIEEVPAGKRGFILGLRLSGNRIGQLVSPLLLGVVAEAAGFGAAFAVGAVVAVSASALVLVGSMPSRDART